MDKISYEMLKTSLLFFFLFSLIPGHTQNLLWLQKSDFGGRAMGGANSFSTDRFAYVLPGTFIDDTTHQYVYPNELWQYNPASNQWMRKTDFPGMQRSGGVSFVIGAKAYYGLSGGPITMPDFWEYDLSTDAWRQIDSFGGGDRRLAVAFCINGKGYVGLGLKDNAGILKDIWEYDPAQNNWTRKADYPGVGIILNTAFVIRDTAYVGMGQYLPASLQRDFWRYEAATDTWTRRADFPGLNSIGSSSFVKNGKGYVVCGTDTNTLAHHDVWQYDPVSDSWLQIDSFIGPARSGGAGVTIGSRAFIGMGNSGIGAYRFLKDFWEFDPDIIQTSISEEEQLQPSISPNPTNGILLLNEPVTNTTITVADLTGRNYDVPHTNREIDVSGLAAGVYVLRLQDRESSLTRRFVKE
ncbi:MAG: T9SS type A sorting domain-containing protein [Bacteroidetes bacterium]|nr:T9SS type A sorting domain-containing protein [Bacteroidota bacterium]